jgi:alpha-tubulin suppressor-like RCC1 family protein
MPTQIAELTDVLAVSVGGSHACAIRRDHGLWCWGSGSSGQLGPGVVASTPPFEVRTGVVAVAAGSAHTCTLELDGLVRCFGANDAGQLGDGSVLASSAPVVAGLSCR